jgi:ferredoxin
LFTGVGVDASTSGGNRHRPPAGEHRRRLAEEGKAVKIRVDVGSCQGHQMCAILAPDLFGSDDEGYGIVLGGGEVPAGSEGLAQRAAASCPEQAVVVED